MDHLSVACIAVCILWIAIAAVQPLPTKFDNYKHSDCRSRWDMGERKLGVYKIYPNTTRALKVFCNHTDDGSFTVIQRRSKGDISFYQNWQSYKRGFGNAYTDYWAGLDAINHLTNTGNNVLRIDMSDWHGNSRQAMYQHFLVMDESQYYRMIVSGFSGNVVDDMAHQNGMYFYTPDRYDQNHCAINQKAGWWFNYCAYTLPNGYFYPNGAYVPGPGQYYDGIYWKDWLGFGYSMKFFSMSLYR